MTATALVAVRALLRLALEADDLAACRRITARALRALDRASAAPSSSPVAGAIIADAIAALVEGRPANPRRAAVLALSERPTRREPSTHGRSRKRDSGHPHATQTGVTSDPRPRKA